MFFMQADPGLRFIKLSYSKISCKCCFLTIALLSVLYMELTLLNLVHVSNILLAVRTGMVIHLFHNGGLLMYSFICMIISLSDLV